jgi:hypothetical protein
LKGGGDMDERQTQLALKIVKLMRDFGFGCGDYVVSIHPKEYYNVEVVLYKRGQRKLHDMGLDEWKLLDEIGKIVKEHFPEDVRKVVTISLDDAEAAIIYE